MKNIKIFSKDWLALHPYVQSTPVDSYYTNIANRIYDILVATELINSFEGDEAKQISIRMAAYFEDARRFIESLDVTQLHVFSYSERPGTQALKIDYVVDPKVKHIRSQILLDLSEKKLKAFYEAHIGREAKVLFEHTKKDGMMHGFTENYIKVETPYDASLINETRRIRLGGWNADKSALRLEVFVR